MTTEGSHSARCHGGCGRVIGTYKGKFHDHALPTLSNDEFIAMASGNAPLPPPCPGVGQEPRPSGLEAFGVAF